MRTTIEISDAKFRKLRMLAADQGARGFSDLINEALQDFLSPESSDLTAIREDVIRRLEGAWGDEIAEEVRARIKESRKHWR